MGNKSVKPVTNPIVPVEMPPLIEESSGMRENEVEVFRITPTPDKCYKHAEYTRNEGRFPDERYYFRGEPEYVGKHVSHNRDGYGNGDRVWDIFNDNGKENRVDYSYAGRTSFIEVPCKANTKGGKRRRTFKRARRNRRKTSRKY